MVVDWLQNIPFWPLTRTLDIFIIDGTDIFHQMGLVVLERWYQSVTYQPRLTTGFARKAPAWYLLASAARALDNPDKLINDCSRFSLSAANGGVQLKKSQARARAALSSEGMILAVGETAETKDDRLRAAETALVVGASTIIPSEDAWNVLWAAFPPRFRIKPLHLNFSTDVDGYNLNTLFRLCDEECPTLLLIETANKDRFGAFLTHPWTERYRQSGRYFGNGDSFIFSLAPKVVVYPWVGLADGADSSDDDDAAAGPAANAETKAVPTLFMFANDSTIAVGGGGGGHAIQLDQNLREGCSYPSDTYGNPGLLQEGDMFTCTRLEVWAFSPRESESTVEEFGNRGVATMMAGLTSVDNH